MKIRERGDKTVENTAEKLKSNDILKNYFEVDSHRKAAQNNMPCI